MMSPVNPSTPTLPDMTGRTIDSGRIQILERLGSGAEGTVYKAQATPSDPTIPREPTFYAVKCMPKHASGTRRADLQAMELALHELVSDHPNIIGVHSVISDDACVYFVLDLCTGGDLWERVTEKKFLGNDELTKTVFLQILDAVEHCHSRDVFHRDLKPENILVSADGQQIYLADFGNASSETSSREFDGGTDEFMSPESIGQTSHDAFSHRASDVWALGIILLTMISSHFPWKKAVKEDPRFTEFITNPTWLYRTLDITEDAQKLLLRILDVDPTTRITISELKDLVKNTGSFFLDPGGRERKKKELGELCQPARPIRISPQKYAHQMQVPSQGKGWGGGMKLPRRARVRVVVPDNEIDE